MKTALVTGGGKGIGLAITQNLLDEGYRVVVSSRSKSEEYDQLSGIYADMIDFCPCDIGVKQDRESMFDFMTKKGYDIDLLVNNAGVAPRVRKDILEIDEDDFDFPMNVNLKGTYFVTQHFANEMIGKKSGRIINISSVSAYTASTNRGEYCIAKAGISMITKLFAVRLAESGVGVFEIQPGIIQTAMTAGVHDKYQDMIDNGLTPIKRFGQPSDIADAVSCIASGRMDFCQGQVVNVDGGFHLRRL